MFFNKQIWIKIFFHKHTPVHTVVLIMVLFFTGHFDPNGHFDLLTVNRTHNLEMMPAM